MADTPPRDLPAEAAARRDIDTQLAECGWVVQHIDDLNLTAGQGVAVREVTMTTVVLTICSLSTVRLSVQ